MSNHSTDEAAFPPPASVSIGPFTVTIGAPDSAYRDLLDAARDTMEENSDRSLAGRVMGALGRYYLEGSIGTIATGPAQTLMALEDQLMILEAGIASGNDSESVFEIQRVLKNSIFVQ